MHLAVAPALTIVPPTTDPTAALAAIAAERKVAANRLAAAAASKVVAAEDPMVQLEEAHLALARDKRAADLAEHELETDAIYRRACLDRGEDMVARVPTRDGSIVLRAEAEDETDTRIRETNAHWRAAEKAVSPTERASHELNAEETSRDALRACVLSAADHFERAVEKFPGLWSGLGACRADLISGRVIASGKGDGR